MKTPLLQDAAFLADVEDALDQTQSFHLWWLGQSGFLLQWHHHRLLLDPYLSDSLTHKYAGSDKPHLRLTERVVAPELLRGIELVTSSHNHTDHLDPDTLLPLMRANPAMTLLIPEANRAFVTDRLQLVADAPRGINAGEFTRVGPFTLHAVPASHETLEHDEYGRLKCLGYVVQFGPWTLYHSGDTVLYDGIADTLKQWPVDVALLPINGRAPERRVAGNLSGPEAAQLAADIGARCVIPCHFDMFAFNTTTPDTFAATCRTLGQPFHVLQAGQRWTSPLLLAEVSPH